MKFFMTPRTCSLSPHIVLEESGLPYEIELVDLKTKVTAQGSDYLSINPKGYVPALLLDSGELLTEGPAIVQYIADQVPEKKLAPTNGTLDRYRLQSWLTFIGTELHRSFTPFFNPMAGDDWKRIAAANLERRFSYTDQQLTDREYLVGNHFTVADAYLFTVLSWTKVLAMDIGKWRNLVAYQARIASRPHVQAVLKAEGIA